MEYECKQLSQIPDSNNIDLLVYHSSIGWQEMTNFLRSRTERLAICYHNITPSQIYEEFNPEFASYLERGRQDLIELKDRVVLTIAVSDFNAQDIQQYGYKNVHTVPSGFTPSRLLSEHYDIHILNEMATRYPNGYVVAVGQILPHKRIEQLVATIHLMNSTYWQNIGLVICGVARQEAYQNCLSKFQHRCAMVDVHFAGQVSDRQLSTFIRAARVYLGMSDHEGLSIPPIEAMSLGIPVVVKGAAAVPETVANGALVLPADAGPILAAEALNEVINNEQLRWTLIRQGQERVRELEKRDASAHTAQLLLAATQ